MSESNQVNEPAAAYNVPQIDVARYVTTRCRLTRHWAVYVDGELLAVTVYRKGAEAIKRRLESG